MSKILQFKRRDEREAAELAHSKKDPPQRRNFVNAVAYEHSRVTLRAVIATLNKMVGPQLTRAIVDEELGAVRDIMQLADEEE